MSPNNMNNDPTAPGQLNVDPTTPPANEALAPTQPLPDTEAVDTLAVDAEQVDTTPTAARDRQALPDDLQNLQAELQGNIPGAEVTVEMTGLSPAERRRSTGLFAGAVGATALGAVGLTIGNLMATGTTRELLIGGGVAATAAGGAFIRALRSRAAQNS